MSSSAPVSVNPAPPNGIRDQETIVFHCVGDREPRQAWGQVEVADMVPSDGARAGVGHVDGLPVLGGKNELVLSPDQVY